MIAYPLASSSALWAWSEQASYLYDEYAQRYFIATAKRECLLEYAAWEEHRAQIQELIDDGEYFANSDGGLGRDVNMELSFKSPLIPYEGKVGFKNGHIFYEKTDRVTGITSGRIPALD